VLLGECLVVGVSSAGVPDRVYCTLLFWTYTVHLCTSGALGIVPSLVGGVGPQISIAGLETGCVCAECRHGDGPGLRLGTLP
jgi:hypothetical protein